jgi:putative ABC transport system permease protein
VSYALQTLWFERNRFLPGILAVGFSCLLIASQCGLLLGLFSITSLPIDEARADVWVGYPGLQSVDLGQPIPVEYMSYLCMPEVTQIEVTVQGFAYWQRPNGGRELCLIIGTRLEPRALGAANKLTPADRMLLMEEGAIIIDDSEFERLGIRGIGDTAEINQERVVVRGTVHGYRSLAGPFIFCSVYTARKLLRIPEDQATFLLAKCRRPEDAPRVVERLRAYPRRLSPFTAEEFSLHSRLHWLTRTKAGIALGLAAALGLLVGAVVTSQTLYAATAASLREYAVLRAMGIPRWRMATMVMAQAFWVGTAGVCLALPLVFAIGHLANELGAKVLLPWQLLAGAVSVTMSMAILSGLAALRSLRLIEPLTLLR